MRIAMIGGRGIPANYGGVERSIEAISIRLARLGHDVTVFCRAPFTPKLHTYAGVRLVRLPTLAQKHLEMPLHTFLSSILVRFLRFDVVHFHSVDPILFAPLAGLGDRAVCTSQGQAYRRGKWDGLAKFGSRFAENRFLRASFPIIAVSRTLKEYYESVCGREVTFIPNAAEIPGALPQRLVAQLGLVPDQYILFIGRLDPTKGCHTAIKAYIQSGLSLPLVIMGGSVHTNEYVQQLRQSSPRNVFFIGHQTGIDYWSVLQHSKFVLFPTEIEGMSIALLEAMGQSRPIIYSDIAENEEVAHDVGLSFRCGDVDHLAERIVKLANNPRLARAIGERAKSRVEERYNWDIVVSEVEAIYRRIVAKNLSSRLPTRSHSI
jgi:glycosyltransferase involved in cell wall biosynthesis